MKARRAFTLIELLVVVAIIGVLISILLPSLGKARGLAKATKCGAQMHSVGKAVGEYLTENSGVYPPSYWYPNADGSYDFLHQDPNHPNGYAHWSSFLFGYTKDQKAFTCPEFESGGLSRTDPGPNGGNWTSGQTDSRGQTSASPGALEDSQAPFMAFTANAAIMPRNKFTIDVAQKDGGSGGRLNIFVKQTSVKREAGTILMTEFNTNWRCISALDTSNGVSVIKSHRPVSAFMGAGTTDEYSISPNNPLLATPIQSIYTADQLATHMAANDSLITDQQSQLNAVGRNHPGKFGLYGGTTNFIYLDGHVERKNIVQTLGGGSGWEWGQSYYSLSGNNSVLFP